MPSILDLPSELRHLIWAGLFSKENYSHPKSAYDLLRASKTIREELAPYLYTTVVFHLQRPHQALHWIFKIGSFNSSCIHRLVLSFDSIQANLPPDDAADIWSSCLGCLPSLETLTYEYDPHKGIRYDSTNPILQHPALCSQFDKALSLNPKLRRGPNKYDHEDGILSSFSKLKDRLITHAILAIDDTMPEILVIPFSKLLQINPKYSLEQNVTCLPPSFFAEHHLHPCRTYLFTEDPQRPSVTLTYRRTHTKLASAPSAPPSPNLPIMLSLLPHLLYLRLGCLTANSKFLAYLPRTLQTLDVAFTDPLPDRVAQNLYTLHERCKHLFTLAIVVYPLHDNSDLPDGGRQINKHTPPESEEEGEKKEWVPFWKALRDIQAAGVRVWEGEGPGFKRTRGERVDDG
ncbi:MAG: hypothetical protein LQ352_008128 [Teloschistes flavicans]|nr:MAG: hypothetical protein LQ352_008128 [Teloschistes flavicans]